MENNAKVTVIIINCQTLNLTRKCIESVLCFYPSIPIIFIDNGSKDKSTRYVRMMAEQYDNITGVLNRRNYGHGPGMHQGLTLVKTRHVLTFDTDCRMKQAGLVEAMLKRFDSKVVYAVGYLQYVDDMGHDTVKGQGYPYVHPAVMMVDRKKYFKLVPFNHHGAPCVMNMRDAVRHKYKLVHFKRSKYVKVGWAGTRKVLGGIPGWHGERPAQAKPAPVVLRKAKPKIIGLR